MTNRPNRYDCYTTGPLSRRTIRTSRRPLIVVDLTHPHTPDKAAVFTLHIRQAVFVDWDINHGLMTIHRWSPASGYAVASRPYP
jgi:hypothetical protein